MNVTTNTPHENFFQGLECMGILKQTMQKPFTAQYNYNVGRI